MTELWQRVCGLTILAHLVFNINSVNHAPYTNLSNSDSPSPTSGTSSIGSITIYTLFRHRDSITLQNSKHNDNTLQLRQTKYVKIFVNKHLYARGSSIKRTTKSMLMKSLQKCPRPQSHSTSQSLWFLMPRTRSCRFLSRTLSNEPFILFNAIDMLYVVVGC